MTDLARDLRLVIKIWEKHREKHEDAGELTTCSVGFVWAECGDI